MAELPVSGVRVAVYTISLNEEQFVDRWAASAQDADLLLVADTGSTDNTVSRLSGLGVTCYNISVKPWRFDDARNASLALIPSDIDYCIVLDMDEVLAPGWRAELERCHSLGATRLRYKYVWSHNPDGSPGLQFYRDGLHARHGYRWKHPVHEVLVTDRITERLLESSIEVHHHPDNTKPRAQYLPLLAQSVAEDPQDDRNAHYYARELFFYGKTAEAESEFLRHLSLPTARWKPERAASCRYLSKCDAENAENWLMLATSEAPGHREAWVDLARWYYERKRWGECLRAAETAMKIRERPLDYLCEDYAWGAAPWDYGAIAAYYTGNVTLARIWGERAIEIAPKDERLKDNMLFYLG